MRFRHVRELFDHWQDFPPENEMLCMFARAYTTWQPETLRTEEAAREAHRKSLESRWAAGAMNAKQLLEAAGGARSVAVSTQGVAQPVAVTGIGPFPK